MSGMPGDVVKDVYEREVTDQRVSVEEKILSDAREALKKWDEKTEDDKKAWEALSEEDKKASPKPVVPSGTALKNQVDVAMQPKKLEIITNLFTDHDETAKDARTGVALPFTRFGLSKVRSEEGTTTGTDGKTSPSEAKDIQIVVRLSNGKEELKTYEQIREMEEQKLLSKYASTKVDGKKDELNDEGKGKLALELKKYLPKFFEAHVDFKAKELALARTDLIVTASKVGEDIIKAKKDNNRDVDEGLKTDVTTAENRASDIESKLEEYVNNNIPVELQSSMNAAIKARAAVLEQKFISDNNHIASLAEGNFYGDERIKGKYDAKRVTPNMTIDESEKVYNSLKEAGLVSDDWADYKANAIARLANKKEFKPKIGEEEPLNAAGKVELARNISKFVSDKKARFFGKWESGYGRKKEWYEAAISLSAAEAVEPQDYGKVRDAQRAESKAKERLDKYLGDIDGFPAAFKEEMLLNLDGQAGSILNNDKNVKALKESNIVELDDETCNRLKEAAKELKIHEKVQQAKAEGKVISSDDKGSSGKGWMAAAALAGAAIAGTAAFTGEDKVENEGKENETRKSKWTFGRVIATVVGVITLGLAVEGLARGDKSFLGKYMAEKGAKSTSALTGLINGRG